MRSYYELTTPLSTIKKQHMVEWFTHHNNAGSLTQPDRWTYTQITGSAGNCVSNSYGLSFWSGGGGADMATINFNDKRQYSHTGSAVIWIGQIQESNGQGGYGLGGDKSNFSVNAIKTVTPTSGYLMLYTADGSTESGTNSSIPYTATHRINTDTDGANWNTYKLEQKSGSSDLTFNGILEVTKTTNQSTAKMQPMAYTRLAYKTNNVRYCEAWNT